jgi:hypothetical protein
VTERGLDDRAARRAALDHVLSVIADSACVDDLVLRGSVTMLAWVGERAREPGDLDWIVRPTAVVPIDDLHPFPYLDSLDAVRVSPEAVHGAARNEIWTFEDFETEGLRAHLPPEGLRWIPDEDSWAELSRPHQEVVELLRRHPTTPEGLVIDAGAITEDATWGYDYGSDGGRARLSVPWHGDAVDGTLQLDFAYDERLPEAPRLIAVPRGGARPPTAVWAATPQLSLAWKLQWLCTDQVAQGTSAGKDLYDAVLLAELDGMRLPPRLVRDVVGRIPDSAVIEPAAVRRWRVDWSALAADHGPPDPWLARLAAALDMVL